MEEVIFVDVVNEDIECINETCHNEITNLQQRISECESKISKSKEMYHKALVQNLKKDLILEELETQLKKSQYAEFSDILSDDTIATLRSINDSYNKDSTFILTAMKHLYRNEMPRLKSITFSGRVGSNKVQMSPKKKQTLKELFTERVKNLADPVDRMKNFGKHVKDAIYNINKANN